MSIDKTSLRIPVESNRRTRSSLNSLIQGLFHTPEWSEERLDLNLHPFDPHGTLDDSDHETETGHTSSQSSGQSITSTTTEVSETKSMWFNDSPRNSVLELADDEASISTSDSHVSSPTDSRLLYFGSISALLSGTHSRSSSVSYAPSDGPPIFVLSDVDSGSLQSSEIDVPLSDCLDDELLSSPLESFAAICWNSAVKTDDSQITVPPTEPRHEEVKTEGSFDFYDPLQYDEYDEDSVEDEYPSGMDILSIEYNPVISEVGLPCLFSCIIKIKE